MRVTFLINDNDRRTGTLLHDIHTWLHYHARAAWHVGEEDADEDDADEDHEPEHTTLLTIKFDDPSDAADFYLWRDIRRRGRRS